MLKINCLKNALHAGLTEEDQTKQSLYLDCKVITEGSEKQKVKEEEMGCGKIKKKLKQRHSLLWKGNANRS